MANAELKPVPTAIVLTLTLDESRAVVGMLDYCGDEPHLFRRDNSSLYNVISALERALDAVGD